MNYTQEELDRARKIISQIKQETKDEILLQILIENQAVKDLLSHIKPPPKPQ